MKILNRINKTWGVNYNALELALMVAVAAAVVFMAWITIVLIISTGGLI